MSEQLYMLILINLTPEPLTQQNMQFLLLAYDKRDEGALERRMAARPSHLEKISEIKKSGNFLFGGAILDNEDKMTGSMIVYEAPDRETLDRLLKDEPYINEGVWENYEIKPFRLAKIE